MEKEKTKIKCRKCLKNKIESFLEKQLWGMGNGQHYRLTCSNPACDFVYPDVNNGFIEMLESKGWIEEQENEK